MAMFSSYLLLETLARTFHSRYYYVDPLYLVVIAITAVIGGIAELYINFQYQKWSHRRISTDETGAAVAERMLEAEGAYEVGIAQIAGHLTDNFDPRTNMLYLSPDNYERSSIASVAVACHEAGHAVQHATGYIPLRLRAALVPVVNFASKSWIFILIAGMLIQNTDEALGKNVAYIAVAVFAATLLFQIVTLPVEFNASRRAINYLKTTNLGPEVVDGARHVLVAAALTYVAATLSALLQVLYQLYKVMKSDRK